MYISLGNRLDSMLSDPLEFPWGIKDSRLYNEIMANHMLRVYDAIGFPDFDNLDHSA